MIREKTGKPVVMHGGSGLGDEDFRRCIQNGVRKINFYTYAAKFAGDAVREHVGMFISMMSRPGGWSR